MLNAGKEGVGIHVAVPNRPADFRWTPRTIVFSAMVGDVIIIFASACIASLIRFGELELAPNYLFPVFLGALLTVNICHWRQLYALETYARRARQVVQMLSTQVMVVLMLLAIGFGLKTSADFSRIWFACWVGISSMGLIAWFSLRAAFVRAAQDKGGLCDRLLLVGDAERIASFTAWLAVKNPRMLSVLGIVAVGDQLPAPVQGCPVRAGLEHLPALAGELMPDRVILLFNWREPEIIDRCVRTLRTLALDVELLLPRLGEEWVGRPMTVLDGLPAMNLMRSPLSADARVVKRLEDYILAALILLIVSPLLILVAILIKIDSPGPVFYMQRRTGFRKREFAIYKFRTMRVEAQESFRQATRGDDRVTRIGKLLRATSIDELPQLLNVLRGDMSLVGPRPHEVSMNDQYAGQIDDYLARHRIKPGITGWAQVNGARGETRTLQDMERRLSYDLAYVDNWSLLLDLQILIRTLFVFLFHKNAY